MKRYIHLNHELHFEGHIYTIACRSVNFSEIVLDRKKEKVTIIHR